MKDVLSVSSSGPRSKEWIADNDGILLLGNDQQNYGGRIYLSINDKTILLSYSASNSWGSGSSSSYLINKGDKIYIYGNNGSFGLSGFFIPKK